MPRYFKWIGYEFASNIEIDKNHCSGYLVDIVEDNPNNRWLYKVELRTNGRTENSKITMYSCNEFKKHFYDVTCLPT